MKKLWSVSAALIALSGCMYADTLGVSSNGAFNTMPSGSSIVASQGLGPDQGPGGTDPYGTQGTPFWNNNSTDGPAGIGSMNIGELLTQSGAFTSTNVLGSQTVAMDYTGTSGADPTDFNFVRNTSAEQVALLYANSSQNNQGANSTVIGVYDATTGTYSTLYSNVQSSSAATVGPTGQEMFPGAVNTGDDYDFYATVCYTQVSGPTLCNTYFSNAGLNNGPATSGLTLPGGGAWNHFALFELSNGNYVIALEDTNSTLSGEQEGDFNDLVIEVSTVPEPETFAFFGLGLAALGVLGRRRFVKK